jgi:hypothetical protein
MRAVIKPVPPPPRPQPEFDFGDYRARDSYRLRVTWFGFVKLEQLYEYRDGTQKWLKPFFGAIYIKGSYKESVDNGKEGD